MIPCWISAAGMILDSVCKRAWSEGLLRAWGQSTGHEGVKEEWVQEIFTGLMANVPGPEDLLHETVLRHLDTHKRAKAREAMVEFSATLRGYALAFDPATKDRNVASSPPWATSCSAKCLHTKANAWKTLAESI